MGKDDGDQACGKCNRNQIRGQGDGDGEQVCGKDKGEKHCDRGDYVARGGQEVCVCVMGAQACGEQLLQSIEIL